MLVATLGAAACVRAKAKVDPPERSGDGLLASPAVREGLASAPSGTGGVRAASVQAECPQKLPAPAPLPDVWPRHRDADFWLSRLAHPDALVLTAEGIAALHAKIDKLDDIANDPGALLSPVAAEPVLAKQLAAFSDTRRAARPGGGLVLVTGASPSDEFFRRIEAVMASYEATSRARLVHEVTALRCLPIDDGLYEIPVDAAFDLLLCSTLRPGEAVREVSRHQDGWSLVRTPYSYGWVRTDALSAPLSDVDFAAYLRPKAWLVVTEDRVPISRARDGRAPFLEVRRGLRLPLLEAGMCNGHRCFRTRAPTRSGLAFGWIRADQAHVGYLPLTQRQVVKRAFAMLDQPYGWGGLGGNRDCSQYLMDLFAMFGVNLPRNSAAQSLSGSELVDVSTAVRAGSLEALDRVLDSQPPRIALLYLPGHIMLLLGRDEGDYYAIHQVSGYRVACAAGHDTKMVVDRVSVTPLHLGRGSERGSFRDRLSRVVVFGRSGAEPLTGREAE